MAKKYQLRKRAEKQSLTRKKIVDATVFLHGNIGPARTSIAAIAQLAGVERPTVYRHFPTTHDLFAACSAQHWSKNPLPDPEDWLEIEGLVDRLQCALSEIYDYFGRNEQLLWNVRRDFEDFPELRRYGKRYEEFLQRACKVLLAGCHNGNPPEALIFHMMDFFAWRSLYRLGFSNLDIIKLMLRLASVDASEVRRSEADGAVARE